jgi:hypothetical protein
MWLMVAAALGGELFKAGYQSGCRSLGLIETGLEASCLEELGLQDQKRVRK